MRDTRRAVFVFERGQKNSPNSERVGRACACAHEPLLYILLNAKARVSNGQAQGCVELSSYLKTILVKLIMEG